MKPRSTDARKPSRRGVTILLAILLIVFMLGMVAFALDLGYIVLVRTQLQTAADASAMAAASVMALPREEMYATAQQYAGYHVAGGKIVSLRDADVQYGAWDANRRTFTPSKEPGNAVRVTARADKLAGGERSLFFGRIFNQTSFASQASAVAMANPRDIAFVVDLSGSMNDDTEPCWATDAVNGVFGSQGYPEIGSDLERRVYQDFNFGAYPGALEYLGVPAGVPQNGYAYAELTKDNGYLTKKSIPAQYRIDSRDNENARKLKAYSWIIDYQIARLMPLAQPKPDSSANFAYWEKYLDYLCVPVTIKPSSGGGGGGGRGGGGGGGSGGGGGTPAPSPPSGYHLPKTPPSWFIAWQSHLQYGRTAFAGRRSPAPLLAMAPGSWESQTFPLLLLAAAYGTPPNNRGTLPPSLYSGRITGFNNPNTTSFPEVSSSVPRGYRNWIGYRTYVQFMMDHGRDVQPLKGWYVPLSRFSDDCPWHSEETAGGTFFFPPREQPTHSARRALIAAMQIVKERNQSIPDPRNRDWVSVITYDSLSQDGPQVVQSLTGSYEQAMQACTQLQACGDLTLTTATETGLIVARDHIKSEEEGGQGRQTTNKVIVLLTDGMPNLYSSKNKVIDDYINHSPDRQEYYNNGAYWCNAALMQAAIIQGKKWSLYPVGVGLGTDYDFMDRMARLGGTADEHGQSPRGTGNPAEYEQRLTDIFEKIISNPRLRLVQ
ncbi:MAG: VWA domain-containing protein [Pirellulales bacterium]|nr:VWA domain-containing protein [Pirellulales bacterium]